MNAEELKAVIAERIRTDDEWDYGLEQCWNKEIEILTRDISQTINFIENECDDDTFCWIGEVFDEVADRTQSKEFVDAIKRRATKVVDDKERRSVEVDVRYAEYKIDDE
ncbi:MAG: hypothetical protein IKP64_10725 [Selenomonadaceae bacterium]|nr:hypothetical protein [Selenomonadaceae bacterium]MBR4384014.1 hypothetical protein [Selenomonadaceae bacterium]